MNNILVINGSPKGKNSITLHTCLFMEKKFPGYKFDYLDAGRESRCWRRTFLPHWKPSGRWTSWMMYLVGGMMNHPKLKRKLQGESIMKGWTNDDRMMISCCNDGTRPVIFKIERIDIPETEEEERAWLEKQDFHNSAEDAYTG